MIFEKKNKKRDNCEMIANTKKKKITNLVLAGIYNNKYSGNIYFS